MNVTYFIHNMIYYYLQIGNYKYKNILKQIHSYTYIKFDLPFVCMSIEQLN